MSTTATGGSLFGRLNDPTASSYLGGACGDAMEFYLVIRDGRVEDVRFHTDGCANTRAFGELAARRVLGQTVREALGVSAGELLDAAGDVPQGHEHCAVLAVSTLYRALADFLLAP